MAPILLTLLAIYLAIVIIVAWVSVHPVRTPLFISPGAMGASQQDVTYQTSDGIQVKAWWMDRAPSDGQSNRTVAICLHGYLMTRSELTPLAVQLWKEGCACLLPDFRSHGRSGGRTCGVGWLERLDVLAAIAWVREKEPDSRIVLIGSSMGAAASALAAGEGGGISALVLDSAYSRLASGALGWWRFLGGKWMAAFFSPTVLLAAPMVGINPFKVDVANALEKASVPTLIIHGDRDRLALPSEAERNYGACGEKGRLVWMKDMNHSEGRWIYPDVYWSEITSFLRQQDLI